MNGRLGTLLGTGLLALATSLVPLDNARAAMVFETSGTMMGGAQFDSYSFEITEAGTDYLASVLDYAFPTDPFAFLGLAIVQGTEVLGSVQGSGSFSFTPDETGSYTALVFGVPQGPFNAGSYGISVESIQAAQVPEPQTWALLFAGLGLLWLRAKSLTAHEARRVDS